MNIINNVSKIYFTEYLYRNYPIQLYKLLQLSQKIHNYFYTAALSYRKVNQASLEEKYDFIKELNELNKNNNWNNLSKSEAQNILIQAAKFDLIYPFIKINPNLVGDLSLVDDLPTILDYIDIDDLNLTFDTKSNSGYLFKYAILLSIVAYYNSQQVAKFLMQNNIYTIDRYGQSHDYTYRINYIFNNYFKQVNTEEFNYIKSKLFENKNVPDKFNAVDIAIILGNVNMVKILLGGGNLEQITIWSPFTHYLNKLYNPELINNIYIINYLLQNNAELSYIINDNYDRALVNNYNIFYSISEYIFDYIIVNNLDFYLNDIDNNRDILNYLNHYYQRVDTNIERAFEMANDFVYAIMYDTEFKYEPYVYCNILKSLQRIKDKFNRYFKH